MASQRLRQRVRPALRRRQAAAMRLAALLESPDAETARAVHRMSDDPLYVKLRALGVLVHRRRAGFGLSWNAVALDDGAAVDGTPGPVPRLDAGMMSRVRALGRERFERLFLADPPLDDAALAAASGLGIEDVRAVRRGLDEATLADDVRGVPAGAPGTAYRRTAHIVPDGDRFLVLMINPALARGDILVRRDVFDASVRSGLLSADEARRAAVILSRMEDLGRRASLLFRILEELVSIQRRFLQTGREEDLEACSRRQLARRLRVHQSLVARAVSGRSVLLPSQRELPLLALLRRSSEVVSSRVACILSDGVPRTDGDVCREMRRRFGLDIPRRTVAYHRRRIHSSA